MNISKSYGLNFKCKGVEGYIIPFIECDKDANGLSINTGLADFLEDNGPIFSQQLIQEIHDCNFSTVDSDQLVYEILNYNGTYKIGLYASPNRIGYLDSSELKYISVADFTVILSEWSDFLNSLSDHILSKY